MNRPTIVLVTGAGQGIGLEWVRQELDSGARVIATTRDPGSSRGLHDLAARSGERLAILPMDVGDDASVESAARQVSRLVPWLDVLVNNAGAYGSEDESPLAAHPGTVRRVLEVNAVGPYRATRALLPLLRKGVERKIILVTSRMGSLGDAPSGGHYAYRMSKAALNMLGANLAVDLRREEIRVLVLHPGWVRTRMGGPKAPVEVKDSVTGMRRVVSALTHEQSGTFLDHEGNPVPW